MRRGRGGAEEEGVAAIDRRDGVRAGRPLGDGKGRLAPGFEGNRAEYRTAVKEAWVGEVVRKAGAATRRKRRATGAGALNVTSVYA